MMVCEIIPVAYIMIGFIIISSKILIFLICSKVTYLTVLVF